MKVIALQSRAPVVNRSPRRFVTRQMAAPLEAESVTQSMVEDEEVSGGGSPVKVADDSTEGSEKISSEEEEQSVNEEDEGRRNS